MVDEHHDESMNAAKSDEKPGVIDNMGDLEGTQLENIQTPWRAQTHNICQDKG